MPEDDPGAQRARDRVAADLSEIVLGALDGMLTLGLVMLDAGVVTREELSARFAAAAAVLVARGEPAERQIIPLALAAAFRSPGDGRHSVN